MTSFFYTPVEDLVNEVMELETYKEIIRESIKVHYTHLPYVEQDRKKL